ncbi:MAG: hypothetical protein AAFQ61_08090 [Cyanobacteria bacterium J06626_23]
MRQIRTGKDELVLRFLDAGNHGLSYLLVGLGRLGLLLLLAGLWLGLFQEPVPALAMTGLGSLMILVRQFVPRLYPEIATCTFNKALNRLTVTHEIAARKGRARFKDRNIAHYQISDIKQINVYRSRKGLLGSTNTLLIELGRQAGTSDLISIDSVHDQVLLQRGRLPTQLLSKAINYQIGRRTDVSWTYVTVPEGLDQKRLGRRVVTRRLRKKSAQPDIHQIASTIEQFIRMP